ncbi:MAG: HAD hydrolase-like protein, partial [Proteobacteria bacterium]|nr:HAD hydrolase-like protein [Pseudomonadota bacterium]
LVPCAGAVADVYEALGGTVIMEGKPFAPIYRLALAAVQAAGGATDRTRVLAIGDGIATDVRGANGQGLPLLFVAEGIHTQELAGPNGALDPVRAAARLEHEDARADYLAPALAW